jgi:hypothetical protein
MFDRQCKSEMVGNTKIQNQIINKCGEIEHIEKFKGSRAREREKEIF